MFTPDFDPSKIKPVRPRLRYATGINREAITALREAGRACSTIEIATAIMVKRSGEFTKRERSDLVSRTSLKAGGGPVCRQATSLRRHTGELYKPTVTDLDKFDHCIARVLGQPIDELRDRRP